jgi:transcriptional regulator with XRE-family HTH domain
MPRKEQPSALGQTDHLADPETSPSTFAKWRRLTPHARNVLARATGREPLATNLRKARENRGLSQAAVAKKLHLSRSLVAQIELANRPVTVDELAKFADLYGTPAVELAGMRADTDDPITTTLLNLAPALLKEFDIQARIHGVLGALAAVSHLERLLERPARLGLPTYALPSPSTLAEAIRHGEEIAERERQRLDLRDAPLPELANLCAAQGVSVFALKLPDELVGLFIAHASVGHAVVVNVTHHEIRQRLAVAHGYAHAVCEPTGTIRVCGNANAKELIERRAAAFAAAFLLPAAGVTGTVHRLGKGQASRQEYWAFDAATEQAVRAEERSTPGSQTMTYLDGVWIARQFGTTYGLAIARLLGLGLIAESDRRRLLRPTAVALAQECLALLGRPSVHVSSPSASNTVVALSDLPAEQFYMAIEAYRRGLITKAGLMSEAVSLSLQLPGLSDSRLLEFAEAAR